MSDEDKRRPARMLDQLPEEQVSILAALEPYEQASLPLLTDITNISMRDSGLQHHVGELETAGLVEVLAEPEPETKCTAIRLTSTGRELIRAGFPTATALLRQAMGFNPGGRRDELMRGLGYQNPRWGRRT